MPDPPRGVPVVLLHGFASSFDRQWRQPGWVDILEESGREVVGVDLLGHGKARKPHDPADYALLEDAAFEQFPSRGQVDAVGFSLGARVLLSLAADHPERFRKVVVAGVGENLLRDEDHSVVAAAIDGRDEHENVVVQAFARFAATPGNDRVALAACMRYPRAPFTGDLLGHVRAPVLVVIGDRDFAWPAQPLIDLLPDARLVTLRGVDHLGTATSIGFIDATVDFLGSGK